MGWYYYLFYQANIMPVLRYVLFMTDFFFEFHALSILRWQVK